MTPVRPTRAMPRIVLAYSGSVNTTVAIPWLVDRHGGEVVTVTLDLGQAERLEGLRERALAAGAARAHVIDAREEFARDFIVPSLRAGAVREDGDPLVTALSRPIIAKYLVEVAELEGAEAVAHGCAGNDRDRQRFEALLGALNPSLIVLAPVRDWALTPADVVTRAKTRGLAVSPLGAEDVDANLWGRTAEHGAPDDAGRGRQTYVLTRPPSAAPDSPASVEVSFEEGVPVAVNGVALSLVELISSVETIAGAHGVGRLEGTNDDAVGVSTPLTIEAPAATVLHEAHRALQRSVTPPDVDRSACDRGADYADLVATGAWFSARREAGDAFVATVQKHVTGTARLTLFKGRSEVVECRSPFALPFFEPARAAAAAAGRS